MKTAMTTTETISPADAIWTLIQSQSKDVRQAIYLRFEEERRKSRIDSESILQQLSELEDGPTGFLRLDTILPPSTQSTEELREEAYIEKYGI